MKKTLFSLLALAMSSFAAPSWYNVTVTQVWVAQGSTPFAVVDVSGTEPTTTYCVYLSTNGAKETLELAKQALLNDLTVKIYVDPNDSDVFYTTSGNPITNISGHHLYALAVPH